MPFCPKCGKEVGIDTTFCPSCGFNLKSPSAQTSPMAPVAPPPTASKPKSNLMRNLGILVVVVVLVIIVLAALASMGGGAGGSGGILPSQHTTNIVNGLITVSAGSYNYYPVDISAGVTGVSLQGSFTASGGSGNDIDVLIMDSTAFTNWQNGHQVSVYYDSGQETTGTVSANLPSGSGTYYLVYSNTFSTFSSKNVQTTVNLTYTS